MTQSEMVIADVLVETEHEVLVAVSFGVPCSKDSRTVQLTTTQEPPRWRRRRLRIFVHQGSRGAQ